MINYVQKYYVIGDLVIIEKDENFIKTRDYGNKTDEEAVKGAIRDKSKIEYFDNNNTGAIGAHGIRTGVGSSRIKCVVLWERNPKREFEIAKNGFYIPIIDSTGKVIYTPEMYDAIREKMQGLSHYGIDTFKVDETAKNEGTKKIIDYIEASKENAENKRNKIIKTLKEAINSQGLELSENISDDIKPGIVEILDTGSTGRGTNTPGDGDFDFMVRIDKEITCNKEKFQKFRSSLKEKLSETKQPDKSEETCRNDFRYKGVTIDGLDEKVDLDLTFEKRTDEITYTTEQAIKDRLNTIHKQSPEDYKYVVANILLAKKEMKSAGAYKKYNAPNPENGELDTRGGLGAVGIENWILQNGGSYEKACKTFLEKAQEAKECSNENEEKELTSFKEKYPIWDFGENYLSDRTAKYPYDNFIDNLTDKGYQIMKQTCQRYIDEINQEKNNKKELKSSNENKISISKIVQEDMSILSDTTYMMAVTSILDKAKKMQKGEIQATL